VIASRRTWSSRPLLLLGLLLLVGVIVAEWRFVRSFNPPPFPRLPDKPSLIVIPFANLSGDPGQEYFSDGVTTDITNILAQLSSLFVISRMSAFTYKNQSAKVRDISREMGVQYVLEGSVRKTDEYVRIAVTLIDATTDRQLWAEQYARPFSNIFAVQDEIVQRIVTTLNLQLTLWERGVTVRKRTSSVEAYDYTLRGMDLSLRAAYESKKDLNAQAQQMFAEAIKLDPQYAEAYARLGETKYHDWFYVWGSDLAHSLEEALQAGSAASALDDSLPVAHSTLGAIYLWKKRHDQAILEAERAVALAPSDADSHMILGAILMFAGEPNRAIDLIEQAMRLNPRYPPAYLVTLAIAYRVSGRCGEALAPLQRAAALAPNFLQARANLAMCYAELDRIPEAQAEVTELGRINPNFSLAWVTQRVPFKDPAIIERMVAAFRKAGLK
jgi:adenylate cyclase